jgi:hypothetical protein
VTTADNSAPLPMADPPAAPPALTYPDAPDRVIDRWNGRRGPVEYGRGEALPPLDIDLQSLAQRIVPEGEVQSDGRISHYKRKLWQLRRDLEGKSELAVLNADLIVHLRRARFPDHAPALFRRVWAEQGHVLLQELSPRWLISSVITFGDFGETEAQRRIGLSLNVLFSLIKLYEFERLSSGLGPDELFRQKRKKGSRLPLGMLDFGIDGGGLDYNLLAPIWKAALEDQVVGPLACLLLDRLNADPSNLFRRLQRMREGRRAYLAKLEARAAAEAARLEAAGDATDPNATPETPPAIRD